jgi:hypothetical protein
VITTYLERMYCGRHLNTVASSGIVLLRLNRMLLCALYVLPPFVLPHLVPERIHFLLCSYSRPTAEPTVVSLLEAFAVGLSELGY